MSETPPTYIGQPASRTFHILRDGFVPVNNAVARSKRLTVYEKVVYAILLSRLNKETNTAWPSLSSLAEEVPCSRAQVAETLNGLEAKLGLVRHQRREGREFHSTEYSFDEDKVNQFLLGEECTSPAGRLPSPAGRLGVVHDVDTKNTHSEEHPKKKSPISIDAAFRSKMQERFGTVLDVEEIIEEALAHVNSKKWTNQQAYVRGWLRREAERKNGGHPNGKSQGNATPNSGTPRIIYRIPEGQPLLGSKPKTML